MDLKFEKEVLKSARLNEGKFSNEVLKPGFTENAFKSQKKEISEMIEKQKTGKSEKSFIDTKSEIRSERQPLTDQQKRYIIFNDFQQEKLSTMWSSAAFETEFVYGEDFPVISKCHFK